MLFNKKKKFFNESEVYEAIPEALINRNTQFHAQYFTLMTALDNNFNRSDDLFLTFLEVVENEHNGLNDKFLILTIVASVYSRCLSADSLVKIIDNFTKNNLQNVLSFHENGFDIHLDGSDFEYHIDGLQTYFPNPYGKNFVLRDNQVFLDEYGIGLKVNNIIKQTSNFSKVQYSPTPTLIPKRSGGFN
jgi:hypothetical protein